MEAVRIFDIDGQTLLSEFPDQTTAVSIILRLNSTQHLRNVTALREKNSDRIILSVPLSIGDYVVELSPFKNPLATGEHKIFYLYCLLFTK